MGCPDWEVSGCTDDHRRLDPGQVFVAIRDARYDGHAFVREALDRGAAGVVVERPCPEAGRLQVVVNDARSAHALICQALAGDPSQRLMTLGVTGTFGKTVTALFVHSILEAAGLRCGLVGSLGWSDGMTTRPLGIGIGQADRPGAGHGAAASGSGIRNQFQAGDRRLARRSRRPGGDSGLHGRSKLCRGSDRGLRARRFEARCLEGVAFQAAVVTDVGVPYGFPTEIALQERRAMAKLFRKIAPVVWRSSTPTTRMPRSWAPSTSTPAA